MNDPKGLKRYSIEDGRWLGLTRKGKNAAADDSVGEEKRYQKNERKGGDR